jgi:hypothetical protein
MASGDGTEGSGESGLAEVGKEVGIARVAVDGTGWRVRTVQARVPSETVVELRVWKAGWKRFQMWSALPY